ncbi:MAG: hypothetical protein ABR500_08870 [Dermatophilaceae bacterium]|nr:type II toxin-antitoxin system VapB family antitoxin [Intrasporangiaceae bacterium]
MPRPISISFTGQEPSRRTLQNWEGSQTGAIESALEAYLRRLLEADEKDRQRRETERDTRLRRILELVESLPDPDPGAPSVEEIMDELYDPATGVPR